MASHIDLQAAGTILRSPNGWLALRFEHRSLVVDKAGRRWSLEPEYDMSHWRVIHAS